MLIKSCDISNEVRPTKVAEPWVDCLLEEYFRQSDIEKSTGLPVTPFMDRDKVTKTSAQIGFIKFVLIPMFENMVMVRRHGLLYSFTCFIGFSSVGGSSFETIKGIFRSL